MKNEYLKNLEAYPHCASSIFSFCFLGLSFPHMPFFISPSTLFFSLFLFSLNPLSFSLYPLSFSLYPLSFSLYPLFLGSGPGGNRRGRSPVEYRGNLYVRPYVRTSIHPSILPPRGPSEDEWMDGRLDMRAMRGCLSKVCWYSFIFTLFSLFSLLCRNNFQIGHNALLSHVFLSWMWKERNKA